MKNYKITATDSDTIAIGIVNDPALRVVLTKQQRLTLVQGLFDGRTDGDDEAAAMILLLGATDVDLQWLVNQLTWKELLYEFDPPEGKARIAELRGRTGDVTGINTRDIESSVLLAAYPKPLANLSSVQRAEMISSLFKVTTTEPMEDAALAIFCSLNPEEQACWP